MMVSRMGCCAFLGKREGEERRTAYEIGNADYRRLRNLATEQFTRRESLSRLQQFRVTFDS